MKRDEMEVEEKCKKRANARANGVWESYVRVRGLLFSFIHVRILCIRHNVYIHSLPALAFWYFFSASIFRYIYRSLGSGNLCRSYTAKWITFGLNKVMKKWPTVILVPMLMSLWLVTMPRCQCQHKHSQSTLVFLALSMHHAPHMLWTCVRMRAHPRLHTI